MIRNPALRAQYLANVIPGEGVLLLSELAAPAALYGAAYEAVLPLLDGTRTVEAITEQLSAQIEPAHVLYALMRLEQNGYIAEADTQKNPAVAAFFNVMQPAPVSPEGRLRSARVGLIEVGAARSAPLRRALEGTQVAVSTADINEPDGTNLVVVLTDDYERTELVALAAALRAQSRVWLIARLQGRESWLGPLYRLDERGCHACLTKRLQRHQLARHYVKRRLQLPDPPVVASAALTTTIATAATQLATEIIKFLAGTGSVLGARVARLRHETLEISHHQVIPDPHCPICGVPTASTYPAPVVLRSHDKKLFSDGGYRSVSAEQTYARYAHLVSPISGLVSEVAPAFESDNVVPVFVAGRNTALRADSLDFLKRGLRNVCSGKGISAEQARTSALCEALERYSGECQGGEAFCTASYLQMRECHGEDAIHPNAVMRFSERQFRERETWNARKSKFNRVPERLDESAAVDWTAIWSLTDARHKYLPTQLLYHHRPPSADSEAQYAIGCSNGCAAGNSREEAALQGLLELVERDATALWWYNRLNKPAVAIESFDDPHIFSIQSYYASLGRETWALDLTSDLGIPAFAALSRVSNGAQQRILFGLGCHTSARIALQRAFSEMNQMLGIARVDDDCQKVWLSDPELMQWITQATVDNQPYLLPATGIAPKTPSDFPRAGGRDLLDEIEHCRMQIESKGMEVLILDQTREDVGLPVVKMVVPGLRHFWARFGEGRLYDVPAQMGWLPCRHPEEQMNPVSFFF